MEFRVERCRETWGHGPLFFESGGTQVVLGTVLRPSVRIFGSQHFCSLKSQQFLKFKTFHKPLESVELNGKVLVRGIVWSVEQQRNITLSAFLWPALFARIIIKTIVPS